MFKVCLPRDLFTCTVNAMAGTTFDPGKLSVAASADAEAGGKGEFDLQAVEVSTRWLAIGTVTVSR